MMRSMRRRLAARWSRRALAAVAGPLFAVAAAWTFAVALIATSLLRSPNPDPALDGDPCCPHPDTWGEVVLGLFSAAALAVVSLGLAVLAVAFGGVAVTGSPPMLLRRHRRKLGMLAVACVVCACAVPVVWAVVDAV
jgi:hypothetical protein